MLATTLAPVWISGQAPNPDDLPSITSDEINAAVGSQDIMAQVAACTNPDRALRALENHSSPRNKVSTVQASQSQAASFGTALAIKFGANNYRTVPAALLMETIPALASDLAAKAHLQLDKHRDASIGIPQCSKRFIERCAGQDTMRSPYTTQMQSSCRIRCVVLAATSATRRLDSISHRRHVATSV